MNRALTIRSTSLAIADCETAILIPDIALLEAGYIKTFSAKDSGHNKHEYHALTQMAYFQYQDDELEILEVEPPMTINCGAEESELNGGLLLCRDPAGAVHVLGCGQKNRKKLLEAAYRYCTRWVRLDI